MTRGPAHLTQPLRRRRRFPSGLRSPSQAAPIPSGRRLNSSRQRPAQGSSATRTRLVFADDAQTRYDIEALTPEGGANRLLVLGHESAKLNVERRRRSIHVTVYQVTDDSPRQNRPTEMLIVGRERRLEEILYADVYVADAAGENVTVVRPFRVRLDDQGSVRTQDGWEKDDLPRLPPHDMVMTREGTIGLSGEQVEKITPLAE